MMLFILSAVGIGLMISSLALNQQQGMLGAFLFLMPAVILSGFATPIANMPEVVQTLTYINPLRYFLIILRGVFQEGDSFDILAHYYWPMVLIALVTLSFADWLFRHLDELGELTQIEPMFFAITPDVSCFSLLPYRHLQINTIIRHSKATNHRIQTVWAGTGDINMLHEDTCQQH